MKLQLVVVLILAAVALVCGQTSISSNLVEDCLTNEDCKAERACEDQKCVNPCDIMCGLNTVCRVVSHMAECSCKPGYVPGYDIDMRVGTQDNITDCVAPRCTSNSECAVDVICIDEKCINPCPEACGSNTACKVINHNVTCTCNSGFSGDPLQGCEAHTVEGECTSNANCPGDKSCLNNICQDPCSDVNCGENTACSSYNHLPMCSCKMGYSGSPVTGCKRSTEEECTSNANCLGDKTCINYICQDPCKDVNCGEHTVCRAHNHLPICSCMTGYSGSPITGCKKNSEGECTSNTNCPNDKMCLNHMCQDPCKDASCGENTMCSAHNHLPMCTCKTGYSGSPATGCEQSISDDEKSGRSVQKVKKFYVETDNRVEWSEALSNCQRQGWRLASIETAEENAQVLRLIRQSGIRYSHFWLAGSDKEIEGHWVWYTTGKTINGFSYWQEFQPDNYYLTNVFSEDCLAYSEFMVLGLVIRRGYWWNDVRCYKSAYYVCEYYE